MSEVLEHLDDSERGEGLAEIRRVLKRGGFIVGTVPYRETLEQNVTICPHCAEVFHRWGHKKAFELADIRKELSPHFHIERVDVRTAFVSLSRRSMLGSVKSFGTFCSCKIWRGNRGAEYLFRRAKRLRERVCVGATCEARAGGCCSAETS